jgi:nucleotide-binding universal stress UspA family protein
MTTKKVLIPVDGSPGSLRALEYAGKKYRQSPQVCLLVLNVQPPMPPSRFVSRSAIADHHARMSEAALKPARALIQKLGLNAKCYAQTGDPAEVIAQFSKRTRCSEIVMGTRGLSRISGLVLGSVAMKVVHLSSVPVTLVK